MDIIKPLEVGDTIPEALLNARLRIVNSPDKQDTVTLNHFRNNKLIILDFWATWCGSCIANMPRTHKLQHDNQGVLFLPVSYEPSEKISSFIKNNHITDSLNIFSIVDDQILKKYFSHSYLPHFVWISKGGRVSAITTPRQLTQANIERMVSSPATTLLPRTKKMEDSCAFLLSDNIINSRLQQYSIFVRGLRPEYITQRIKGENSGQVYRKCMINWPLRTLYTDIVGELLRKKGVYFNETLDVIMDLKNPGDLDFNQTGIDSRNPERQLLLDQWDTDNLYSYDVIFPVDKSEKLYEYILQLLNDSTPFNATIEKRVVDGVEKQMLVIRDDN
ncbi:MAG: TlpA family protein disulfide reductase [Sphingobacterium sp.]|nr:TlpA family protein disulfide reductase [Sphingobacterium sp.]